MRRKSKRRRAPGPKRILKTKTVKNVKEENVTFPKTRYWHWGDPPVATAADGWGVSPAKEARQRPSFPRENPVIAALDADLDALYIRNYKLYDPDVYGLLVDKQYKPADVRAASDKYQELVDDIRDPDAKEGYNHLTPAKKHNYIAFVEKIIAECQLYLGNSRKSAKVRKPRKRKIKSADQLTSKVQFKAEDTALKLVSVAPSTIVDSTAVWLFNTKYRKLTYLAAGGTGSLTLKGTTVKRFDPAISKTKKLRKPQFLNELMGGTKASMLKSFSKLKVKEYVANGRINRDTLILKVIR